MVRKALLSMVLISFVIAVPQADAQKAPPPKALLDMANGKRKPVKPAAPVDAGSLRPYPGSRPFQRIGAKASDAPVGKKGAAAVAAAVTKDNRKAAFYTSDPASKILTYYKSLHEKAGYQMTSQDNFKTRTGADATSMGFYGSGRIVVVQVYHGKVNYAEYAANASSIPAGSNLILVDVSGK